MKRERIENFTRGWFIGNFEPAILKTEEFEVGFQIHKKNETIEKHYQELSTEYNLLLIGSLIANGETLGPGDIFIFDPKEVTIVELLEECHIVCVKTPSLGFNDKVVVE